MEKIFDMFLKKEMPGNTLMLDAYSQIHDIKPEWLSDHRGLTIQELIDTICDNLESQGYDLSTTAIDEIKHRFVLYEIKIEAPKEYIELREAKNQAEDVLKNFQSANAPAEFISQVNSMISLLETKMKEMS